jgi:hypothetical protein
VGDSYDLDAARGFAVDNEEGKSVEEISASPAQVGRPLAGGLLDACDCCVELTHEGVASFHAPDQVPLAGCPSLFDGFRMKP